MSKYVGRPLIDAFLLAEEVHFYGAVFHHSIEEAIERMNSEEPLKIGSHMVNRGRVPMKDGAITHYYLCWRQFLDEYSIHRPKDGLSTLYSTASGKPRKYVDNTADLYWPNVAEAEKTKGNWRI